LEDGGWVEFQLLDSKHYARDESINEGNRVLQLYNLQTEALSKVGRKLDVGDDIEEFLKQAGFQNVTHRRWPVPLGGWPKNKTLVWNYREQECVADILLQKRIGVLRFLQFESGLESSSLKPLCKVLKWTRAELELLLMGVRKDLKRKEVHLESDL
jgi:hypothetical protein